MLRRERRVISSSQVQIVKGAKLRFLKFSRISSPHCTAEHSDVFRENKKETDEKINRSKNMNLCGLRVEELLSDYEIYTLLCALHNHLQVDRVLQSPLLLISRASVCKPDFDLMMRVYIENCSNNYRYEGTIYCQTMLASDRLLLLAGIA